MDASLHTKTFSLPSGSTCAEVITVISPFVFLQISIVIQQSFIKGPFTLSLHAMFMHVCVCMRLFVCLFECACVCFCVFLYLTGYSDCLTSSCKSFSPPFKPL